MRSSHRRENSILRPFRLRLSSHHARTAVGHCSSSRFAVQTTHPPRGVVLCSLRHGNALAAWFGCLLSLPNGRKHFAYAPGLPFIIRPHGSCSVLPSTPPLLCSRVVLVCRNPHSSDRPRSGG